MGFETSPDRGAKPKGREAAGEEEVDGSDGTITDDDPAPRQETSKAADNSPQTLEEWVKVLEYHVGVYKALEEMHVADKVNLRTELEQMERHVALRDMEIQEQDEQIQKKAAENEMLKARIRELEHLDGRKAPLRYDDV